MTYVLRCIFHTLVVADVLVWCVLNKCEYIHILIILAGAFILFILKIVFAYIRWYKA